MEHQLNIPNTDVRTGAAHLCCDTLQVEGFNMCKDGMTARTIKAQYYKTSAANFLSEGSYGATGVIEIAPPTIHQCDSRGIMPNIVSTLCESQRKQHSKVHQRTPRYSGHRI